ncbi:GLPGLI family protein [Flavobacterium sp.]|jgi:GLPGLI family protein|uniref:GLPGLI family protein n=1 Tax=Flavobacterium sp. TaxID=239 RepID=UPI0037BFF1F0
MNNIIKICFVIIVSNITLGVSAQGSNAGKITFKCFFPNKKQTNLSSNQEMFFNSSESIQLSSKNNSKLDVNKEDDNSLTLKLPYGDSLGRQIYRSIKEKIVITRRPKNAISEAFIVKENWIEINWKIESKTKKIGNYTATMAKGSFRGRDYTAWFTYDIPAPFGPWKLHGLPGLILEAEDSEKMMRFYATEVIIPFETNEIIKVPTAENEITHKEEIYLQDNFDKILAKKMNARLPKGSSLTPTPNDDGRKYREEKTFEWEIETIDENKKD